MGKSLREFCAENGRDELLRQWDTEKNGGKTPDGLLPVPGEAPAPDPADQERISREREKILRELESVPGKLDDPWREAFSGKSAGK